MIIPDNQISTSQKIRAAIATHLPRITGKVVQFLLFSVFAAARFIGSLFRQALGKE